MSAAGPLPRRSLPLRGRARSAKGGSTSAAGPPQGARPPRGERREATQGGQHTRRTLPSRQGGATLFVVLVLLLAMAWFSLSAFRISSQQLQIVGNSQAEQQATAAAQRAIDLTISSNAFTKDPAAVAAIAITTDIDGDGNDDFAAKLEPKPKCIRVRPIKNMELDVAKAADRVCLQSSGSGGNLVVRPAAVVGAGDSMCANTEWNIAAVVSDATSNTEVTVHQGVAVRVVASDAANHCK